MTLNVYKEQTKELDLVAVANEFVSGRDHRMNVLEHFNNYNIYKMFILLTIRWILTRMKRLLSNTFKTRAYKAHYPAH